MTIGRPFKKGQSGNPGGRPRFAEEVRAAARRSALAAVDRLVELAQSGDERVALAACNALLDRAVGKPQQEIEASGGDVPITIVIPRIVDEGEGT